MKLKPPRRERVKSARELEYLFRLDLACIVVRRIMTMPKIKVSMMGELSHLLGVKITMATTKRKSK